RARRRGLPPARQGRLPAGDALKFFSLSPLAGRGEEEHDSAPGKTGRASFSRSEPRYSEYLNSGMFFSSSLLALNTAWSGYHFDEDVAVVVVVAGLLSVPVAAPVVVVAAGLAPGLVPAP